LQKPFVTGGYLASKNARRYIKNIKSDRMADGGTTAIFTEDVDGGTTEVFTLGESDEISRITLSLDIPSPLSDDAPEMILDGKKERIVMVYDGEDPKFTKFELLSNEDKRGTAQFANRAAWVSET
jgi:hypothetical protein